VTEKLEYRPFLRGGDLDTMASVPLITNSTRAWPDPMATVEMNFHMLDVPSRGDDRASLVQRSDGRRQTGQT